MSETVPESEPYVRAAHFFENDSAALFGALAAIHRCVDLVVIEDPTNPLLRRHAEIRAAEMLQAAKEAVDKHPGTAYADMTRALFGGNDAEARLIEEEIANLQGIIATKNMGVFAVCGTKPDVLSFIQVYSQQPGPR